MLPNMEKRPVNKMIWGDFCVCEYLTLHNNTNNRGWTPGSCFTFPFNVVRVKEDQTRDS